MATLSATFRICAIALVFAITIPCYLLIRLWSDARAERFSMPVFSIVAKLMGATVSTIGTPRQEGPCLIAANHISWTDIILVASVVPATFIAKSDVEQWPVFGMLARIKRSLFVEREKPQETSNFKDAMQERFEHNEIVILFAEGTSSDGNRVLPFKSALFSAVEDKSVPIQPLSIAYTGLGGLPMGRRRRPYLAWYGDMDLVPHLWNLLKQGRFETELRFHDALNAQDFNDRKHLALHCEEVVREGLVTSLYRRVA